MRYIIIFMLFTSALFGQQQSETIRGSMIAITKGAPTFVPGPNAPWFAKDTTNGNFYEWDWIELQWFDTGSKLYETGEHGPPTYTPGKTRKRFAVNLGDSLYRHDGTWKHVNPMPDLSGYLEWADTASIATQYFVLNQGFLTVELDGDPTNELQTISISNDTIFLSDGGFAVIAGGGGGGTDDQQLSIDSVGRFITVTLEDGGAVTFEDRDRQFIDTFGVTIVAGPDPLNELRLSISNDGQLYKAVNMLPYLDNTDNQTLTIDSVAVTGGRRFTVNIQNGNSVSFIDSIGTGGGGGTDDQKIDTFDIVANTLRLSLEDDGEPFKSVNLAPYLDNTDNQVIDTFIIVSNVLRLSVEDDGQPFKSVDLSAYLDNTDNQTVDTFSLSGTVLTLALEDDGEAPYTVDLASLQDGIGTDDQKIDTFAIVSNVLRLSIEGDAEPFKSVDLTPYLDNTDDQTLSIDSVAVTGGRRFTISIEDGNSISFIDSIADGGSVNTDSTTVLFQDSILIYYTLNGVEYDRDTIRIAGGGGGGVSGSGTTDYMTKWTGATVLGNSIMRDNGSEIGVGVAPTTNERFNIQGMGSSSATASLVVRNSVGDYTLFIRDDNILWSNAKRFHFGNTNLSVYIGQNAGINSTGVVSNVGIGYLTGANLTTGGLNLLLGREAGNGLTTGDANTAIGRRSLYTSANNIQNVIAIGNEAGGAMTGVGFNFVTGLQAGYSISGSYNIALGDYTMYSGVANNTAVGMFAAPGLTTSNNVVMGYNAARYQNGGTVNLTTAYNSTYVGNTTKGTQSAANENVFGYAAQGKGSNSVNLGNTSVTAVWHSETVGWFRGTGSPESVVTAPVGSKYSRTDGSTNTATYRKETGSGNTGWVADASGSDDQTISLDSTVEWYTLSIESANSVSFAKPRIDTFAIENDSIRLSLTGDNVLYRAVDLYEYKGTFPPKVEAVSPGSITFGNIHQFDLSAAPITTVCPSGAVIGTRFSVSDGAAFSATNNLTVDFTTNSQKLYGTVQNYILNVDGGYAEFIYMGAGTGWIATK